MATKEEIKPLLKVMFKNKFPLFVQYFNHFFEAFWKSQSKYNPYDQASLIKTFYNVFIELMTEESLEKSIKVLKGRGECLI